jgi:predicted regulator of Ras-like GTPase activity (Roadblock/LC7/MglB family)
MTPTWTRRTVRELARKQLETLGQISGVQSAVLFSPDGFEIASHGASTELAGRLAAIGSSLTALGSAVSIEAGLEASERTIVESAGGTVMIMRLDSQQAMSLAVVTNRNVVLGRLLWATRNCCHALSKVMDK